MANPEDIERAQQGMEAWNAWAKKHANAEVDFTQASLQGIDFSGFMFPGRADFREAKFKGTADFSRTRFIKGDTNFIGATFEVHASFLSA